MDEIWKAATVLAALELVPGDPSDLTALLRDERQRKALLEPNAPTTTESAIDAGGRRPTTSPLGRYLRSSLDHGRVEAWAKTIDRGIREHSHFPIVAGDRDYPYRLQHIWDAPPILFSSLDPGSDRNGNQDAIEIDPEGKSLAIVGGREATRAVLSATQAVAAAAADHGVRVVSGLAAGVDTAAHEAAIHAGGLTTAVLGTGIEHVFPSENHALATMIRRHGVLISQFAPPAPRTGTTFLRRNAVIAALSDASLIMDGRERSGSRHEIEQAARYGRPVLLWAPALAEERWAKSCARAGWGTFVESTEDVIAVLG